MKTEWCADCYLQRMRGRGKAALLWVTAAIGIWFIFSYAFKYLTREPSQYGIYAMRYQWLYAHIIAGIFAMLLGPVQFWLGLNRLTRIPHRIMGVIYVLAVAAGGTTGCYLAPHNDIGWVFGLGFASMAVVWIITSLLATLAICLHNVEQHREWMVRSYTLNFGFVTSRALFELFDMLKLGTFVERKSAAVWAGWAIPLFITEAVFQTRKIF